MKFFMNNYLRDYFKKIYGACRSYSKDDFIAAARLIALVRSNGKKIIIVGNGGSAAMASHVSVDFVKAAKIRAINFNEADLITCFANDYGYENWLSQAISSYADSGDLLIAISSSGKSKNILNAVRAARKMRLKTITFSGFSSDNRLRRMGDVNFWVDSCEYNTVEMVHHIWLLALVDSHALDVVNE